MLCHLTLPIVTSLLFIGLTAAPLAAQESPVATGGEVPPSQPPPEEGEPGQPPGYDFVARGGERLLWEQAADGPEALGRLNFTLYVGGAPTPLTNAECAVPAGPDGFACQAPLPVLAPGVHLLWVAAVNRDEPSLEGAPSTPITVLVETTAALEPAPGASQNLGDWLVSGLEDLTDLGMLPDGRVMITERSGRVLVFQDGEPSAVPVLDLDDVATAEGRGLLSLAIDRDFARSRAVFVLYSTEEGLRVARFYLAGGRLTARAIILDTIPLVGSHPHGLLRMGPDGALYLALDDRGSRERAGDLSDVAGKLLRFNPDGTVPRDQPAASPVVLANLHVPASLAWTSQPRALWLAERTSDGVARLIRATPEPNARPTVSIQNLGSAPSASPGSPTIVVAAEGLYVSTGTGERSLRHLDVRSGSGLWGPIAPLRGDFGHIRSMAIAQNGSVLAVTATALVRIDVDGR